MVGIHAGCLAAPFFFTWQAIGVALVAHWLTSSVGVCLGYHRYLSHKSFKLTRPAEFFVLFCSVASGQGSPLMWSATHRLHHQRSDQEGDPHSPLESAWWGHILWLFVKHTPEQRARSISTPLHSRSRRSAVNAVLREVTYGLVLVAIGVPCST